MDLTRAVSTFEGARPRRSRAFSLLAAALAFATGCGGDSGSSGHPHGTGAVWPGEAQEHVRTWLRTLPRAARRVDEGALLGAEPVPASFDARTAFLGPDGASLIMGALDQGDTENCWVYSPASVVADRLRIAYAAAGTSNELFSTVSYQSWSSATGGFTGPDVSVLDFPDPVQIVECCGSVCSGVSPSTACSSTGVAEWTYTVLSTTGAPSFADLSLQACGGSCPGTPQGAFVIRAGTPYILLEWDRPWESSNPSAIQSDVAAHGPVTTYMQVPEAFHDWFRTVTYPSGPTTAAEVFDTTDTGGDTYATRDQSLGGHFVAVLGWGTTSDAAAIDYWIVRNSWGQSEADQGIFLIQRGINFCMIEQYAQAVPTTVPD